MIYFLKQPSLRSSSNTLAYGGSCAVFYNLVHVGSWANSICQHHVTSSKAPEQLVRSAALSTVKNKVWNIFAVFNVIFICCQFDLSKLTFDHRSLIIYNLHLSTFVIYIYFDPSYFLCGLTCFQVTMEGRRSDGAVHPAGFTFFTYIL